MGLNWDDEDLGDGSGGVQYAEQQFGTAEDLAEQQLAEAEARLQETSYLRFLMEADLFGEPNNPVAQVVQAKVRDFARKEIGVILGTAGPGGLGQDETDKLRALSQLSPQEIGVLKLFLSDLGDTEVLALRTFASKVVQDPGAVGLFVRAAANKQGAKANASAAPARPNGPAPRSGPLIPAGARAARPTVPARPPVAPAQRTPQPQPPQQPFRGAPRPQQPPARAGVPVRPQGPVPQPVQREVMVAPTPVGALARAEIAAAAAAGLAPPVKPRPTAKQPPPAAGGIPFPTGAMFEAATMALSKSTLIGNERALLTSNQIHGGIASHTMSDRSIDDEQMSRRGEG